jgi:hypothetical protein
VSRRLKFLIASPSYNPRFGGVMALHQLCDALNRLGHEAAIALFGGSAPCFNWAYSDNPNFYHPELLRTPLQGADANTAVQEFLSDGFVVYPDLIPDNPLSARRVVRYLLYKNHSYQAPNRQEFVLSFSGSFHDQPDAYLFNTLLDPEFHTQGARHWSERTLDLTYIGKGSSFGECHRIPDTLLVKRDWPEDKNQLGHLLRSCRYFYSWDSISQTNVDAVVCGAMPVLLNRHADDAVALSRSELGAFPELQLVDTADKNSLSGDMVLADQQTTAMRQRIADLEVGWPLRVQSFIERLSQFFELEQESVK